MTTATVDRSSSQSAAVAPAARRRSRGFWRMLWPLIRPWKWLVILALALNAFHGLAITFQNVLPTYLIDRVILAPVEREADRWPRVAVLVAVYLAASVFGRMLIWHIGYRIFTYVREKVVFQLRGNFFRHVNHLCLRFHIKHNSGELFSYLFGSPLQQLQGFMGNASLAAPGAVFTLLSTLVLAGTWDPVLTAVLLALAVSTVVLMQFARRRVQRLHNEYQKVESNVSGYVADLLRGSRDVKLYAMEDKVAQDFEERAWEIGKKVYQRDVQGHIEWMKQETAGYVGTAVLCVAALWRYQHDRAVGAAHPITTGQIVGFMTCFGAVQQQLNMLFQLTTAKGAAQAGLERMAAVLDTDSTTPDPVGYEAEAPPRGDILLYSVTFGYERERPVLHDVNLRIPYGQRVALVGPSGAGKSTITQLLLRLYDPDVGAVVIGGLNIRHCAGPELRKRFGVVPQDPFIFRTTIRENLRVIRPEANDAQLRQACELANAWEFIGKLPKGLDTEVGEGGATLSGGQRQRLSIARALLTEPDFFIFDEATSALDTVSEHMIQTALEGAMRGRTALVIAHRLATVRNCDRILVMKDGRVVQDGPYAELVAQPGVFKDLVEGQTLRG